MKKTTRIVVIIIAVLFLSLVLAGLYLDYLWFANLGYGSIYFTLITNQYILRLLAFLVYFLFLFANLFYARQTVIDMSNLALRQALMNTPMGNLISGRKLTLFFAVISLILSFLITSYTGQHWLAARQFLAAKPFGIDDPIFGKDAAFYVFSLPFLRFLYEYLFGMVLTATLLIASVYFFTSPPEYALKKLHFLYEGRGQLSFLLAALLLLKAWSYRLASLGLVHSPRGVATGASYTDIHAQLPANNILLVLALVSALALMANIFIEKPRIIIFSVAGLITASLLLGSIYPAVVQKLQVEPNEFTREEEYIRYNIDLTREAFGLNNIVLKDFSATDTLTAADLKDNRGIINNIRLWDYRPLQDTFNQMQGIRPYYSFQEVDTDRYTVDGDYRQVMLAARELDQQKLAEESKTWVNNRLQYTHGYGVAMSPVNEVAGNGLPAYFISDVPPKAAGGMEMSRPQIYFGELTDDYVIVNTLTEEFDYPMGDTNAYTTYTGSGGIPLGGLFRRLLFSFKLGDYQILLSGGLNKESRVMFDRNIFLRTEKIAPFLTMDGDPYIVVHDGGLYWIRDAYTTSNDFPYSESFGGINYMRNAVKVVVDAYNGTVDYYISDPDDPIINTYAAIFPGLFKPLEEMPAGLKVHLRYPETYFLVQTSVLNTYHMQDTRVFYTKEDQWQVPTEHYSGRDQAMEPYYTILNLPEEESEEFVLMLPLTPNERNNMIAWLAARMDGDSYGEMVLYNFPKERTIWGPQQIESRINQNSVISQQMSLWDQRGSNVLRGNLLVIPIEESVLYIEPLYLQAEQSKISELVRVIIVYGDEVVMAETLEEGLEQIFGAGGPSEPVEPEGPEEPGEPGEPGEPEFPGQDEAALRETIRRASELFAAAQEKLGEGDWAEYGRLLEEMETLLKQGL